MIAMMMFHGDVDNAGDYHVGDAGGDDSIDDICDLHGNGKG